MQGLGKDYKAAEAVQGGEFKRLPAGGYICKIVDVEDCPQGFDKKNPTRGNYLWVVYDIADGEYKGFYSDDWGKEHPYAHRYVRSYSEKALGMFKGFLQAVDESNNTDFVKAAEKGFNEKELVGKLIGLVIGYEEYVASDGEIKERAYVNANRSVSAIKSGDFKVPELKKVKDPVVPTNTAPVDGFAPLNDDDIPF